MVTRAARPRRTAAPRGTASPAAPAREDAGSRARLLRAGQALVARHGLRGLTVRAVAARARVNLGSFVYHFGTREAFVDALIEGWYAPFYAALQLTEQGGGTPRERLRALLVQLLDFVTTHREFVLHVIADAAAGEPAARRFLQSMGARHPALVLRVLEEAQRAGSVVRAPALRQMAFLIGACAAPVLVFSGLAQAGVLPRPLAPLLAAIAADRDATLQRLDWALAGLATDSRGEAP